MESIIRKWGNSPALRLPSSLLNEAGLAVDQRVRISVVEGSIRIERVRKRPAYRLEDLLAKATEHTRHGEVDWGPARGHEGLSRRQADPEWSPDQGDIIYLDFDPQSGHEQAGRRPALVLSPRVYNSTASLALCCPLTTKIKGWPFEVDTETDLAGAKGVVLADQIKALDWRARNGELAARVPKKIVADVLARLKVLLPGI